MMPVLRRADVAREIEHHLGPPCARPRPRSAEYAMADIGLTGQASPQFRYRIPERWCIDADFEAAFSSSRLQTL